MKCTAQTEPELREVESPWPKSMDELTSYINSLTERSHDYGTCVYAMSLAATAAFNYVASKEGCTGFQASCADLDFIRRSRSIKGPFMLIKAEDALFPQSDPADKLAEARDGWKDWLKTEAQKKLDGNPTAHSDVIRHWATLAGSNGAYEAKAKFLESQYDWTEEFVEAHVAEFKQFGIKDVYLMRGAGSAAKADTVKEGCSFRISMPTSLDFERNIDGIKIRWSVDTELEGSNGTNSLRFDWAKLDLLAEAATGEVKAGILAYIEKIQPTTPPPEGGAQ